MQQRPAIATNGTKDDTTKSNNKPTMISANQSTHGEHCNRHLPSALPNQPMNNTSTGTLSQSAHWKQLSNTASLKHPTLVTADTETTTAQPHCTRTRENIKLSTKTAQPACITGECRAGDIVAVLPRLELAAVDVVVAHASAKSYAAEAAKTAGWTAARAEQTKRTRFRKDVPDHAACRFVPFVVETCGYMGTEAVKFVKRLGDIAAESGRIPKGAIVCWAILMHLPVQRGNAEMYRRSGLIVSREPGLRYDAGFAVPVLMS